MNFVSSLDFLHFSGLHVCSFDLLLWDHCETADKWITDVCLRADKGKIIIQLFGVPEDETMVSLKQGDISYLSFLGELGCEMSSENVKPERFKQKCFCDSLMSNMKRNTQNLVTSMIFNYLAGKLCS